MLFMYCSDSYFTDRLILSLDYVKDYQKEETLDSLNSIKSFIPQKLMSEKFNPNPFCQQDREDVNKIIYDALPSSFLVISKKNLDIISEIYWGVLCPRISKVPLDSPMEGRIIKIWEKHRTLEGIAETLYDINNSRRSPRSDSEVPKRKSEVVKAKRNVKVKTMSISLKNRRFYEEKNMYTPLHEIQKVLEEKGLEFWSQEEEDQLINAALVYDHTHPSSSSRKGFLPEKAFQGIIAPSLPNIKKRPIHMWDQWNQRSSLWIIGQEIRPEHVALLQELYATSSSAHELSEKFAAAEKDSYYKIGMYYPDRLIQEFYNQQPTYQDLRPSIKGSAFSTDASPLGALTAPSSITRELNAQKRDDLEKNAVWGGTSKDSFSNNFQNIDYLNIQTESTDFSFEDIDLNSCNWFLASDELGTSENLFSNNSSIQEGKSTEEEDLDDVHVWFNYFLD
jgi:hypothetical protein